MAVQNICYFRFIEGVYVSSSYHYIYRSINWHPRASKVICLIEPPKNATKGTWWCPNNWCKGSHRVWTKDLVVSLLEPLERIGVPKNVQWHVTSDGYLMRKTRDLQSGGFFLMHKKTPQIQVWLNFWFPPCLYISVALLHSFKARSVQLHMTKWPPATSSWSTGSQSCSTAWWIQISRSWPYPITNACCRR